MGKLIDGKSIAKKIKEKTAERVALLAEQGLTPKLAVVLVGDDNEHIVFSNRAANSELEITEKEQKEIVVAEWIYITSLSGKWRNVLRKIFAAAGPKIAWNPGHIQLRSGHRVLGRYFKKTYMLSVNKDEALELVVSSGLHKKKSLAFLNNTTNLLKILKEWGPQIVVITCGKDGAYAYDGEKIYFQEVLNEKKRVDTTGVGDAFGATFVSGLKIYKENIKKAMLLGAKNTSSVIAKQGAQNGLITKKDI